MLPALVLQINSTFEKPLKKIYQKTPPLKMKKTLAFILFISSFIHAQYTINGRISSTLKSDWVILYKIENTTQNYVQHSKIKRDTVSIQGQKDEIISFQFILPENSQAGSYRIAYGSEDSNFVDFFYNKENILFKFDPSSPNESISFLSSRENILYRKGIALISKEQRKLDAIQNTAIQNSSSDLQGEYLKSLKKLKSLQKEYLEASKGMYIQDFISASLKKNPTKIITDRQKYQSHLVTSFFDPIDFSNKKLINSPLLTSKIIEYIFSINYVENPKKQNNFYKKSIEIVCSKIKDLHYKKEIIEFLIAKFETINAIEILDFLLLEHYTNLPAPLQDKAFLVEKKNLLATQIGSIAPNFSWEENGETLTLSKLKGSEYYLLIFWSTECSHCLREIPQLHHYLGVHRKITTIAFSLERNDVQWKNYKQKLANWHHVFGGNKWENKIVKTYNINATPSYFILDSTKKIIAKPYELSEVKAFIEAL